MADADLETIDLVARIPDFLQTLARLDSSAPSAIEQALADSGLDGAADWPRNREVPETHQHIDLVRPGDDDPEAFQRRLRAAITRKVGKPSGTDKRWDVGGWAVTMSCHAGLVSLGLHAQFSMSDLRRAASAWLDGAVVEQWLVEHGFVDAGARPDDRGRWPRAKHSLTRASITSRETGETRVHFFMEAGIRPPGTKSANDDERFQQTLEFLGDVTGAPLRDGAWRRNTRSFSIRRMKSFHSRSVDFGDAPVGRVHAPFGGSAVTIDATPEPEPHEAASLLRQLSDLRGLPFEEARRRLIAEGAVTQAPARELPGTVALLDPHGRDIEFGLVDGRVARSIAQVAPESKDANEAISAAFTDAFGEPSERWTWAVGATVTSFANLKAGAPGFERYRAQVAEPTSAGVAAARSWLLAGEALGQHEVRDDWHGRCLGAAISGEVVPAAVTGQPIWRVDDRLLWLEANRLIGAQRPDWPSWATALAGGGTTSSISGADLARFAQLVSGWREPSTADAAVAVTELGWATDDPDALAWSSGGTLTVRLRRPAEGSIFLAPREVGGPLRAWTLTVARNSDAASTTAVRDDLDRALAPYRDTGRPKGWRIGAFLVVCEEHRHRHLPALSLRGTVSLPR
ncbi:hypothetical protein OCAE111667_01185 [Occultella aeris]|uniref:Uncharacterized protein n=1 Tax=Occultella aeris TaxID=2761496 RepID=A0A7M4DT35_9MICO|nr:hypothetical protein [Occultella aeris]VZO40629.1 hypothetical protein HALOF300_05337 [Occultella aeris]